jgi:hypothetical protein
VLLSNKWKCGVNYLEIFYDRREIATIHLTRITSYLDLEKLSENKAVVLKGIEVPRFIAQ